MPARQQVSAGGVQMHLLVCGPARGRMALRRPCRRSAYIIKTHCGQRHFDFPARTITRVHNQDPLSSLRPTAFSRENDHARVSVLNAGRRGSARREEIRTSVRELGRERNMKFQTAPSSSEEARTMRLAKRTLDRVRKTSFWAARPRYMHAARSAPCRKKVAFCRHDKRP